MRIERKINEVFKDKNSGQTLMCVRAMSLGCEPCACIHMNTCPPCLSVYRVDKTAVQFKEVEEPIAGMLYRCKDKWFKLTHKSHGRIKCICEVIGCNCGDTDQEIFGHHLPMYWCWELVDEEDKKEGLKETKRHISIQTLRITETEATFRIVEQTHRNDEFASAIEGSRFKASNGIILSSISRPMIGTINTATLFVRGTHEGYDNEVLTCSRGFFNHLLDAVDEYNVTEGKGYSACGMVPPVSRIAYTSTNTFKRFWMVYLAGADAPTYRHESLNSAKDEAERLSRKYNKEAFVLESVESCKQTAAPVAWKQAK